MAYLDNYRNTVVQLIQGNRELPPSVANLWPAWEVQSPQHVQPSPYSLAQTGYRRDELVYACIDYRAGALAEPPVKIYQGKKKVKKELSGVFESFPGGRPNREMGEAEFWSATEIYRCIAGAAIWEIELNRMGQPINLWPLNPAYCSFLRGPTQPIRAVRYLYPGLEPVDIPRERLLIFMEFDPLYPMLKGLSRTSVALRSINVHTSTTDFLNIFFQRGMMVQGYLKAAQSLNDKEATRAQERWRAQHGGVGNWANNNVAVLGSGMDFVQTQMDFRSMQFGIVDGRTEAAICMVFAMSPLLLGAQVGLDASTLSNYDQAANQFLTRVCKPSWRWYSSEITQQLLPYMGHDDQDTYAEFDTSDVSALQEDEDALWERVDKAVTKNIMYRDEARASLGLDPVDAGEKVFLGVTLSARDAPTSPVTNLETDFNKQIEQQEAEVQRNQEIELEKAKQITATPPPEFGQADTTDTDPSDMANERAEAIAEVRAGKSVIVFGVECRSASDVRKQYKTHWPKADKAEEILATLKDAMKLAAELRYVTTASPALPMPMQPVNILFPNAAFAIEHAAMEVSHEIKSQDMPAIIVQNIVEPTPITNLVNVEQAQVTVNNQVDPTPVTIVNRNIIAKPRERHVAIERDNMGRAVGLHETNDY